MAYVKNNKSISKADHEVLWRNRWRARTDLLWLAKNVLNMNEVEPKVHGPMTARLQKFPLPTLATAQECDKMLDHGKFSYTPWINPYELPSVSRRNLILAARGTFKTSLNTIAHSIQWLLNFPERTIALIFSADQKGQDTLKNAIKWHFQYNQKLRELFPDYCPQKRISDWGTAEQIILPNRDALVQRLNLNVPKEPSIMTLSIDKAGTGYHFDVMKCSDIVETTNVITPTQREQVKQRFGLLPSLLVHPTGWIDVEGTLYHHQDLHRDLIVDWRKRLPEDRVWNITIQPIILRDTGDEAPRFDAHEMSLPWKKDKDGNPCPLWPERFPLELLNQIKNDPVEGGLVYAGQRLLDLDAVDDEFLKPLQIPLTYTKREAFRSVPVAYHVVVVDMANTVGAKANPSCVATFAIDRAGRAYVHDIRHGKFTPDKLIEHIFDCHDLYHPIRIVIEETGFTQGLKPSIKRYEDINNVYPNWVFHPAPRTTDKATRIINALGPPLRSGELRFIEPLHGCKHEDVIRILEDELKGTTPMSTGSTDDIIDTLAWFFLDREWLGREGLRGGTYDPEARQRLLKEQLEPQGISLSVHQAAFKRMVLNPHEQDPQVFDPFRQQSGW